MFRWVAAIVLALAVMVLWVTTMQDMEGPAMGLGRFSGEQIVLNVVISCLALAACYVMWGSQAWRRRLKRVIYSILAICLVLFLVELPAALGLADYGTLLFNRSLGGDGPNLMQLDGELLFRHPPHDRFVVEQPWDMTLEHDVPRGKPYEVEYVYDKNGFRNSRDFQEATVVLVGDSFVEGYLVPQEQICAPLLARTLGVCVCNLGQNDYGPAQELVVVQRYAVGLHPRVVVWFYYEGNDLFDLEDYESLMAGWRRYFVRPNSFVSRSFCSNALHRWGGRVERFRFPGLDLGRKHPARLLPEIRGGDVIMQISAEQSAMSSGRRARLATGMQGILRAAKRTCRRNGVEFLVAYAPATLRVYRDLCVIPEDSPLADVERDDFPGQLGRWCATTGIDFLDLTVALKAAARDGTLVYFPRDEHWSRHGHAVAAEEIARFVRDAGWVDSE